MVAKLVRAALVARAARERKLCAPVRAGS